MQFPTIGRDTSDCVCFLMRYLRRYYHNFWPHSHSTDTTAASCLCYQLSCKSAPTGKAEAKWGTDTFSWKHISGRETLPVTCVELSRVCWTFFFSFFCFWQPETAELMRNHGLLLHAEASHEIKDLKVNRATWYFHLQWLWLAVLERKWGVSKGSRSPPVP